MKALGAAVSTPWCERSELGGGGFRASAASLPSCERSERRSLSWCSQRILPLDPPFRLRKGDSACRPLCWVPKMRVLVACARLSQSRQDRFGVDSGGERLFLESHSWSNTRCRLFTPEMLRHIWVRNFRSHKALDFEAAQSRPSTSARARLYFTRSFRAVKEGAVKVARATAARGVACIASLVCLRPCEREHCPLITRHSRRSQDLYR